MSQEKPPLEELSEESSLKESPKKEGLPIGLLPTGSLHGESLLKKTDENGALPEEATASSTTADTHNRDTLGNKHGMAAMENRETESPGDAEQGMHTSAQTASGEAENTHSETVEPMKGVGFLGRRGTAPINTMNASDVASNTDQAEKQSVATAQTSPEASSQPRPMPASTAKPALPSDMPPPKPGMAENSFRLMSYAGLIFLTLLLAMQTAAGVYFPTVFLPQEAALVEVYELMAQGGQWLAPPATAALPAALPGYFWFLSGVNILPGLGDSFFLPVATALSALITLLGTYMLGLSTGLGKRVSFAAGLMLLSMLGFAPLAHWVGADMLLAGILALSLACLHRGWVQESAFLWLASGFVLAGAATLVGGFMALWIPLVASIFFIFWRGTLRRGHRLDAVLGFALLLISIASWLGAVILFTGDNATVLAPLFDQLAAPLMPPYWPPQDPWWLGLALLGAGLLPWIFIPLFVSWNRVTADAWPALKASRKETAGVAWLWICLVCGLLLLLACSAKPLLMAVPLLPLAALLLAKALIHLSHAGSRLFFLLLGLLCLVAGVALSAAGIPVALSFLTPYLPATAIDLAAQSAGLPLLGGVLLLAALILVRFTNRAYPGGALAVFVLLTTMLVQPATLLTGPSHAGKLAVYLPKGMGAGVLAGGIPVVAPTPIVPEELVTPEPPVLPIEAAPEQGMRNGSDESAGKPEQENPQHPQQGDTAPAAPPTAPEAPPVPILIPETTTLAPAQQPTEAAVPQAQEKPAP